MNTKSRPAAFSLPPALQIEIELEATPRLTFFCQSEEDTARLLDWLNANPQRVDLVNLAVELGDGAAEDAA